MTAAPVPLRGDTRLRITTITDWHVGTGTGVPGDVDALVRRDVDGLPYLPGSSLTGVVRDACLTVARALDDGAENGLWQHWHAALFGGPDPDTAPRPAAVAVGAGRIPAGLRRALLADPALAASTTTVRAGVRIDPESGRAADKMLRFVELARGGVPLEARLTVDPTDGDAATATTALLVLGLQWCDRIGGDRRRGPGQVHIEADGQRARDWAAWLADTGWQPPAPPEHSTTPVSAPRPMTAGPGWQVVDLTITTADPVRVPLATAGNVVRGHDYLPGSVLLPWLSERWGRDLVRDAVAGESLAVRHAHPDVLGERGLPVPATAFRNRLPGVDDVTLNGPAVGARQVRDRWTSPEPAESELPLQDGGTGVVSHNSVDRDRQRPTSETGIFEVEVLPAGRRFHSRLVVADNLAAALRERHGATWWQALAGPARLGARRRGEYGGVKVEVAEPRAPDLSPSSASFTVWLCSDVLVRSSGLRLSADPDDLRRELARLLGTDIAFDAVTARTSRRDSWHAGWQRPRESFVGLGAGGVVTVRVAEPAAMSTSGWQELQLLGWGERRAEGFGEVLLDAPLLRAGRRTAHDVLPTAVAIDDAGGPLDSGERAALRSLRQVVARDRVAAAIVASRNGADHRALHAALADLSASQRGTWRAVTADAAVAADPRRALDQAEGWLAHGSPRRAGQRTVARLVTGLLGGHTEQRPVTELLAEHGVDDLTPADATFAVAALVADAADALRRERR